MLPKQIVYPTGAVAGVLLVAGAAAGDQWGRLGVAAACGAVAWTTFVCLHLVNLRGLGFARCWAGGPRG